MASSYLISGARTPIGSFLGGLSSLSAPKLGGIAIEAAMSRGQVAAGDVDEVIMGNVIGAGVGQAPARQAALAAGLPNTIAALTINKVCGSGLKAVMLADQAIRFLPNHRQAKRFRTYFHGTRAQALMQLKHMPQAIKDFKIALEDRPNDPEILAFLAECYQAADIKPPKDLEARLPNVAPRAGAEN